MTKSIGGAQLLAVELPFHKRDELQGLRFVWKINPYHSLQVSNTYPSVGVVFIIIRLNKLNVFAAELNGSRVRFGLESTIGSNLPSIACDSAAIVTYVA
jgi:hypothetical protein